MKQSLAILALVAASVPAGAQIVGHSPDTSPFRDLEFTQEWTFFSGYFHARKDPLDVAPQSGPITGSRWDVRIAGPVYAYGRMGAASLVRREIDTKQPIGSRYVGTTSLPLLFSDIGLDINLTGFKTWHGLVPEVSGGGGFTADLKGQRDVSDYRFGNPFTITYGAGIKWVPGGHWQVRADMYNYIYQIHYPGSYFIRVGNDDPVLLPGARDTYWRRNVSYQLGITYLFHR